MQVGGFGGGGAGGKRLGVAIPFLQIVLDLVTGTDFIKSASKEVENQSGTVITVHGDNGARGRGRKRQGDRGQGRRKKR